MEVIGGLLILTALGFLAYLFIRQVISGPVECARCTRTMKYKEWLGNDSSCIHCQFSEQNRTVECINCQVKMTLNRWLTNQGCIGCGTDLYR